MWKITLISETWRKGNLSCHRENEELNSRNPRAVAQTLRPRSFHTALAPWDPSSGIKLSTCRGATHTFNLQLSGKTGNICYQLSPTFFPYRLLATENMSCRYSEGPSILRAPAGYPSEYSPLPGSIHHPKLPATGLRTTHIQQLHTEGKFREKPAKEGRKSKGEGGKKKEKRKKEYSKSFTPLLLDSISLLGWDFTKDTRPNFENADPAGFTYRIFQPTTTHRAKTEISPCQQYTDTHKTFPPQH